MSYGRRHTGVRSGPVTPLRANERIGSLWSACGQIPGKTGRFWRANRVMARCGTAVIWSPDMLELPLRRARTSRVGRNAGRHHDDGFAWEWRSALVLLRFDVAGCWNSADRYPESQTINLRARRQTARITIATPATRRNRFHRRTESSCAERPFEIWEGSP